MKQAFIILSLVSSLIVSAHQPEQKPLNIYLCSRLTQSAQAWNNVITQELEDGKTLHFFRPQDVDLAPYRAFERDDAIYKEDFAGMRQSDLLLVLPPYGRDCAWEIGWFCGAGRVAIAYAEAHGEWVGDPMIKGGLTAIITNNPTFYQTLLEDPLVAHKAHLIASRDLLGDNIKKIYHAVNS